MKKYISVFAMITRSTLYKVLIIMTMMVGVQSGMFVARMTEYLEREIWGIEGIVDASYMIWPLAIGFLLITIVLCLSGCNIGSNQGYTLKRLQISEKAVNGLQICYNCIIYALLWASQVAVMVGMSCLYMKKAVETTNQTIVMAFYKNDYMHCILPMKDRMGWLLLMLFILGCGITAAAFPYQQRRGKIGFSVFVAVGITLLTFPCGMNDDMSFLAFYPMIILLIYSIYQGITSKSKEVKENG